MTLEEYDEMSEKQRGKCAICGLPETKKNQHGVCRLAVDHDHETGEVRGLLCCRCNTFIGYLEKTNKKTIEKMFRYII